MSAHEILVHPGQGGKADFPTVADQLATAPWLDADFGTKDYHVTFRRKQLLVTFPGWLYDKVYKLRNDFLHGNPIDPAKMTIGTKGHAIGDVAAGLPTGTRTRSGAHRSRAGNGRAKV